MRASRKIGIDVKSMPSFLRVAVTRQEGDGELARDDLRATVRLVWQYMADLGVLTPVMLEDPEFSTWSFDDHSSEFGVIPPGWEPDLTWIPLEDGEPGMVWRVLANGAPPHEGGVSEWDILRRPGGAMRALAELRLAAFSLGRRVTVWGFDGPFMAQIDAVVPPPGCTTRVYHWLNGAFTVEPSAPLLLSRLLAALREHGLGCAAIKGEEAA